jgi:dephospho-CoA kinase
MIKIGITGGIGAGKSFIASQLEKAGFPVFYADDEAKWAMQQDEELVSGIKKMFGDRAYVNWELQTDHISRIVFTNKGMLDDLNKLVHPVIMRYFNTWCKYQDSDAVFMEAAILFETGGYKDFDHTILVFAPETTRIERVMKRDNCSREKALNRIHAQWPASKTVKMADFVIENDNRRVAVSQMNNIITKKLKLKLPV